MGRVSLTHPVRERGGRYRADLVVDREKIGYVERGWSQGGAWGEQYVAKVEGVRVAIAHNLADLRVELEEWLDFEAGLQKEAAEAAERGTA